MLSDKEPSEEFYENNQEQLQKIVGEYLYYAGSIDPTILCHKTPPNMATHNYETKILKTTKK